MAWWVQSQSFCNVAEPIFNVDLNSSEIHVKLFAMSSLAVFDITQEGFDWGSSLISKVFLLVLPKAYIFTI